MILVTGATGLVGNAIAARLAARGDAVRALVRDVARAKTVVPEGVELVKGDLDDPVSLAAAMAGVELVFHAAGMPEQWQADESTFDRVNRLGTRNVAEAALAARVDRVVYTSTMDVFAAPRGGTLVEDNVDPEPKPTAYERSKQAAEREVEAVAQKGLEVVYVNPAAVYGPSPVVTGLNVFLRRLLRGEVPMLPPGGMPVAFVDGVADVHLAAAERGAAQERYPRRRRARVDAAARGGAPRGDGAPCPEGRARAARAGLGGDLRARGAMGRREAAGGARRALVRSLGCAGGREQGEAGARLRADAARPRARRGARGAVVIDAGDGRGACGRVAGISRPVAVSWG